MRRSRAARTDPVRRALLAEGLARLGIDDPERGLAIVAAFGCHRTRRADLIAPLSEAAAT